MDKLYRAAGTPATARLPWWRSAVTANRGAVPVLLSRPGPGGTLTAAALVALRDQDGCWQLTSGRPHSDDVWEVAAVSPGARQAVLAELARFTRKLDRSWQLTLTGLRDGDDAAWLAGQLPAGCAVPAQPVPGIGFTPGEMTFAPGIRRGLDRAGRRIGQHALTERIQFEREPARLAALRDEIEAVHLARDHDAGRVSDLDDAAGLAFWRSVYDRHAARGELEVATLRLDGQLAAYVIALVDPPAYRVFDGRFAPAWRLYSPGRRLEARVVDHARRGQFRVLDWMSSVAPEKLVASTWAEPRWAVTAAGVHRGRRQPPHHDGGRAVKLALTVLGSSLTAAAALPYIIDIVRGRARPRIASWGIWAVVQAVGAASGFAAGQLPGACYTLFCAAGCAAVVVLGWRYGSRDFGPLDAVCVTLAAEGVALLSLAAAVPRLIPMSWAVAISVGTDFLAYLPTFRHAWLKPEEEPWLPYALFGAAAALVLWVTDYRILAGVIYPAYLFAADSAMVVMILASPHCRDRLPSASRPRGFALEPLMRLSTASAQWRPVTGRDWRQS